MTAGQSGGDFLAKKSEITRIRKSLPTLTNVLVVDDEEADADRLRATLRVMFGYDIEVRRAPTLGLAVDAVLAKHPEVVFLDDILKPSDSATDTIPFLRRAGYEGPIIVVSGAVTKKRRLALTAIGASDVIHKDEIDSVRLAESLINMLAGNSKPAEKKPAPPAPLQKQPRGRSKTVE